MLTAILTYVGLFAASIHTAWAECPTAHTHIGVNPTWRPDWNDPENPDGAFDPDPTDDHKLWFFSLPPVHPLAPTPGWPNWGDPADDPFLWLVPETDPWGDPIQKPGDPTKYLFVCRFMWSQQYGYGDPNGVLHLDGWHSADGPQGAWNLENTGNPGEPPAWDIWLRRESSSVPEDDFFMMLPDDTVVLDTNGAVFQLGKQWEDEEEIWEIHAHMGFYFWLPQGIGQEVSATFSAYDAGGMYEPSDAFEFRFVTVPEPSGAVLLLVGLLGKRRWR